MRMTPKRRRWIQIGLVVLILGLIVVLYLLRSVLWPFIFAFFIAYVLNPWINWLQKKKIPRTVAILIVLVLFSIVVTAVAWLSIPQAIREFSEFAAKVPAYVQALRAHYEPKLQDLMLRYPELRPQIEQYYNTTLKAKLPSLFAPVFDFVSWMFSGVLNFLLALLNLALV